MQLWDGSLRHLETHAFHRTERRIPVRIYRLRAERHRRTFLVVNLQHPDASWRLRDAVLWPFTLNLDAKLPAQARDARQRQPEQGEGRAPSGTPEGAVE